jgi:formate dehydrogenase iron-sulfur subunit
MIRSASLGIVQPKAPRATPAGESWSLLRAVLAEQQQLTAVERFARQHEEGALPAHAKTYKNLLPATSPGPGQQYAFNVDLDACTGCKACVAACHSLNGLDEGEVWRTVGLLHGGSPEAPAQQTVTTSCHHCVDPACMKGCPVKAYEKDPVTGIVKHLDDQCIGCQYCTLMCPYDAPKYSPSRGIVRKCDMCSDRLSSGEAPACVQACPNGAIRISVVDQAQAVQASEAGTFLPGAPAPDQTIPTTVYRSKRDLPRNLLPADFYTVSPEHAHLPLVIMLILTQLSVGAFVVNQLLGRLFPSAWAGTDLTRAIVALGLAGAAIGAATFHLGRPQFAFRAVLGLRTSWMSREILAFGVFAKLAALYALTLVPQVVAWPALRGVPFSRLREGFALGATVFGLGGVACSAMIYAATRRVQWRGPATAFKFFASLVILGAAATRLMVELGGAGSVGPTSRVLVLTAALTAAVKLLFDASALRHLAGRAHTVEKRVALLMVGDLRRVAGTRFFVGVAGLFAAGLLLFGGAHAAGPVAPLAMFVLFLAGESCERYLFFRAAPPSRMPGALE